MAVQLDLNRNVLFALETGGRGRGDAVQRYAEGQRQYAQIYAAEGAAEFATWTKPGADNPPPLLTSSCAPSLAASMDIQKHEEALRGSVKAEGAGREDSDESRYPPTPEATTKREKYKRHYTPDEAHEQRLRERRERRRAKAAIMQKGRAGDIAEKAVPKGSCEKHGRKRKKDESPSLVGAASDEPGDDTDEEHLPKDDSRKKKQKITRGGVGLLNALKPTNIGRDRITLQPASTLGVFNKGKASAKIAVKTHTKDKTRRRDIVFSESKFLNSKRLSPDLSSTSSEPGHSPTIHVSNYFARPGKENQSALTLPASKTAKKQPSSAISWPVSPQRKPRAVKDDPGSEHRVVEAHPAPETEVPEIKLVESAEPVEPAGTVSRPEQKEQSVAPRASSPLEHVKELAKAEVKPEQSAVPTLEPEPAPAEDLLQTPAVNSPRASSPHSDILDILIAACSIPTAVESALVPADVVCNPATSGACCPRTATTSLSAHNAEVLLGDTRVAPVQSADALDEAFDPAFYGYEAFQPDSLDSCFCPFDDRGLIQQEACESYSDALEPDLYAVDDADDARDSDDGYYLESAGIGTDVDPTTFFAYGATGDGAALEHHVPFGQFTQDDIGHQDDHNYNHPACDQTDGYGASYFSGPDIEDIDHESSSSDLLETFAVGRTLLETGATGPKPDRTRSPRPLWPRYRP